MIRQPSEEVHEVKRYALGDIGQDDKYKMHGS